MVILMQKKHYSGAWTIGGVKEVKIQKYGLGSSERWLPFPPSSLERREFISGPSAPAS